MTGKIVVIGDVMLDKYDFCSNAENPESSAPCWTVERTEFKPGGAGNVAANLASLGANFELISVVGEDYSANVLKQELQRFKVPCSFISDSERQTIVKERIMSASDGRYHCRINRERKEYIGQEHVQEIIKRIDGADIVLVSDYRKGTISKELMDALRTKNLRVIVDAKPEHVSFYHNLFLVKPNAKEARVMTGLEDEVQAGEALMKKLGSNVLLTRGSRGISYFGIDGTKYDFPAEERKVVDVTGAGDTAIATFTHYLVKGKSLEECIRFANRAAGISVQYPGCHQITEKELE